VIKLTNFQGLWITSVSLWKTPHNIAGQLDFVKPTRRYLFHRFGKSSLPSLSISILAVFHMKTANIIGEHKNKMRRIAINDPNTSIMIFSFVFYFSCVFFFIANRLRRIATAQFLNAFYFI
jgi:hypothetical protein